MGPLSRLWFVVPPDPGTEFAALLEELVARPLAALVHGAESTSAEFALRLSAAARPLTGSGLEALDALAALHPDRELAVVAGADLLLRALAHALGTPAPPAVPALPRHGGLNAFHWPTGIDPRARAELIGLDLDWFPPWHGGQPRSRFPGGPGVAGTARG
ncbi:MAG TPA: hypothetical protein VMT18_03140 [Planctomycetota bacterium]|nr:hypothetical protein [Planctomycetota bacterium]